MADDGMHQPTREFGISPLMARWRARDRDVPFNSGPNTPLPLRVSVDESISVALKGVEAHASLGDLVPTPQIGLSELVATVHLVDFGEIVTEGQIVIAVVPLWRRLLKDLAQDPEAWLRLTPRQLEEWRAGAYEEDGFKVILTPRTRDGGRDIIATREDLTGSVRILDDVKRYALNHVVGVEDVRQIHSTLMRDDRASKAIVTTTSRFSPDVYEEFARYMPTRLDLWDGKRLQQLAALFLNRT